MKRLALAAAVLVLAACSAKNEEPAVGDTSAPAMAPAPADTGMGMMRDSAMMKDSAVMKDSSAMKP